MKITGVLLCTMLMVACAAPGKDVWVKGGSTEQEFNQDFGYCRAQGFSVPGAMQNLLQVAVVQNSCMQAKGWRQERRP